MRSYINNIQYSTEHHYRYAVNMFKREKVQLQFKCTADNNTVGRERAVENLNNS
jgi:hypothetical protein